MNRDLHNKELRRGSDSFCTTYSFPRPGLPGHLPLPLSPPASTLFNFSETWISRAVSYLSSALPPFGDKRHTFVKRRVAIRFDHGNHPSSPAAASPARRKENGGSGAAETRLIITEPASRDAAGDSPPTNGGGIGGGSRGGPTRVCARARARVCTTQ